MTLPSLRLTRLATGGSLWAGLREYFAYHGIWAPGVRVLRRMSVRSKLLLVMGLIIAPLLPLTWQSIQMRNDQVEATSARLVQLRLAGALTRFEDSLYTGHDGQPPKAGAAEAAWTALQEAYAQALRSAPALQQTWERSRNEIEAAVQTPGSSPQSRAENTSIIMNAVQSLRSALVEQVLTVVEGDPVLNNLTLLTMDELPDLQSSMTRMAWQIERAGSGDAPLAPREMLPLQLQLAARLEAVGEHIEQADLRLAVIDRAAAADGAQISAVREYQRLVRTQALVFEPAFNLPAIRSSHEAARQQLNTLWQRTFQRTEQGLEHQLAAAHAMRLWVVGTLLSAMALSGYLLYCFFLVMRGGLTQLNHQMLRMAEGDLSARPLPVGGDEVAATMRAMNASLVRLSDLLASVRLGVGGVNQASQQVATGNVNLTDRNRETAISVAAVVDGVVRYTTQLEACGRQVETVVNTVQELRLESARNRKQMHRLRERMTALRSKSSEIGEIVTLIDAIAFRTNILALNASVEASKAGESGRGFAVVAQEVRTLALRGAESARRIGDIVGRSTEDIELSGALAEETGQALAATDEHVDSIRVAMDDVAALTHNGEKESAEILRQLTSIRDGTAQSLGLVEQLAGASMALHTQGERLAHKVGQFRLS